MARIAGQGSNWIHRATRLAIYDRDNHRCVYCNRKVKPGRGTSGAGAAHLDHLHPSELGGSSRAENLVTSCGTCNDRKATLSLTAFLKALRAEGVNVRALPAKIRAATRKPLDRAEGRRLAALGL